MYDKITNRINNINEVIDIIIKTNNELKENNSYINSYIDSPLSFLDDD